MKKNYQEERKICIMDCIWNIIFHWRRMIVCIALFSVLFGAMKYVKDYNNANNADKIESEINNSLKDITEEISQLSGADKTKAEMATSLVKSMVEKKEYATSSAIMQLDPYNVNSIVLQYHLESVNNVSELLQAYSNSYLSPEAKEKLVKAADDTISSDDVVDMITVRNGGAGFQVNNSNKTSIPIGEENSVLYIIVRGVDKEKTENMADAVKDIFKSYNSHAEAIYGKHTLTLVSENYQLGRDEEVVNIHEVVNDTIYYNSDKLNQLTGMMGADAVSLIENYEVAMDSIISNKQTDEDATIAGNDEIASSDESVPISKKWILLGAFFGLFCIGILEVLYWLIGGQLNSAEELQHNFDIRIYGVLDIRKKHKVLNIIDGIIYKIKNRNQRILDPEKKIEMIVSEIILEGKKKNIQTIYLTGTNIEDCSNSKLIIMLKNMLKEKGISLVGNQNILYNPSVIYEVAEIQRVVIIEETKASKYYEISRELQMCNEQNIEVLGGIILNQI